MPIFKRDKPDTSAVEEHRLQSKVVSPDLGSDPEARVIGVVPEDDVFGGVNEDGPNYRNVGIHKSILPFEVRDFRLTTRFLSAGMDRYGGAHVQDASRSW
jgi:hypothetical protein